MSGTYDPLNPASPSPFASSSSLEPPPWPTTPHFHQRDSPTFPRPATPSPPSHNDSDANTKEPQIYGQPERGLISPKANKLSNGGTLEKTDPYLRIRITGLDRNRRDILIRFDAQTNLRNFSGTTFRNISRSYVEFQKLAEQLVFCNPQTIVPALPLPQTSAPSDEEDDRLVKVMLQRWLTRVCDDPVLISDEDVRSFVESDFGYQPTVRPRRKTTSSFSLLKRSVPDEDEELLTARFELVRLETQFIEAAKAVDKLARARKALAQAHTELGSKFIGVATAETHPQLAAGMRKLGRALHVLGDNESAEGTSETVILGDSLGYQGMNAKSAKETLQQRSMALEEHQTAVKTAISKRRQIERLKASTNIRPERVDEAVEELKEASQIEEILTKRVQGISENLHKALITHSRHTHEDVTASLIEHARTTLMYERIARKEFDAVRNEVKMVNQPRSALPSGPAPRQSPISPHPTALPRSPALRHSQSEASVTTIDSRVQRDGPYEKGQLSGPPASAPPGSLPASPTKGYKSVIISPSRPNDSPVDPLLGTPAQSPITPSTPGGRANMTRSMFIQPQRGRIDEREAARKLANFL
ncbi:Vps5 C terminal like-domain-containing protein [Cantharellus anzutake]|uniref:Vps5 C terminal like-domain-containing protein n=1 Tax=Cantharellus anzutake TaxID=1750568 RepID=UPI0019045157|nr:Vps5 C terminal like-domain-containing protein [Cantharellus anzutake]KAF8338828.1 Vps5 C terminal like-domain-containing protein [Cantharellus anzutake]